MTLKPFGEMKTLDSGTIRVTVNVNGNSTSRGRMIAFQLLRLEFWPHCRSERLNYKSLDNPYSH